jgi:hypothetical protein
LAHHTHQPVQGMQIGLAKCLLSGLERHLQFVGFVGKFGARLSNVGVEAQLQEFGTAGHCTAHSVEQVTVELEQALQ